MFLLTTAATIFISRYLFIELTPSLRNFPDIRIYQAVGKAILADINPYDYSDRVEERRRLRLEMARAPDDFVTANQDIWDYYLSANPPGSSFLYALFEKLAHGSRHVWRELFIAGDVLIFIGLCALMASRERGPPDLGRWAGMFCLVVFYPLFSMALPFVSEDKQFQTALLLFGAAMLLGEYRRSAIRDLLTGFVLSLGVVFKLFGIILLPLWLSKLRQRSPLFALWSVVGGSIPPLASFWAFGAGLVTALRQRNLYATAGSATSGSPWQLLPPMAAPFLNNLRPVVALLCCAGLVALFVKKRVDALNFGAGLGVVLGCIWLQNGSMDRMNIVIMFAIASLATLSTARFLWMSLFMTGLSALCLMLKVLGPPPYQSVDILGLNQRDDGILVAIFILAYGTALLTLDRRSEARVAPGLENGAVIPNGAQPEVEAPRRL